MILWNQNKGIFAYHNRSEFLTNLALIANTSSKQILNTYTLCPVDADIIDRRERIRDNANDNVGDNLAEDFDDEDDNDYGFQEDQDQQEEVDSDIEEDEDQQEDEDDDIPIKLFTQILDDDDDDDDDDDTYSFNVDNLVTIKIRTGGCLRQNQCNRHHYVWYIYLPYNKHRYR